jgi:hypothetical protein
MKSTKKKGKPRVESEQPVLCFKAKPRVGLFFIYIYFITILLKYIVRHKFCKNIHLAPWSTASGT